MKQVLVPKYFFNSGKTTQFSSDTLYANPIGFVSLDALDTFLSSAPTNDFAIMYRHGTTQSPSVIEVDYNSLTVVKATPISGGNTSLELTMPSGEAGKQYTINIVKCGAVKHERNLWRLTVVPKDDCTAAELAALFETEWNKVKNYYLDFGVTVVPDEATLLIVANQVYPNSGQWLDYQLADNLIGATIEEKIDYIPSTLTIPQIKNLLSEGIANRGANYTYEEGTTIYPNVLETLDDSKTYYVYTLRFANPRKASKTRDEVVYQLVHLVVDSSLTTLKTFIEAIKAPSKE